MPSTAAYFLADAHLGTGAAEREAASERRLHEFLHSLAGRATDLFVVGDLFDFWFEYRTAIPRRHFPTLAVLRRLHDAGVRITYLNGNHDFWLGSFLAETIGARTIQGEAAVELQGRRIWLHHGDGLMGGDLGYKVLRSVLRSPVSIRLYQLLHPDLGLPLAHAVSAWSRRSRGEPPLDPDRLWNEIAQPRFRAGFDAVMVGHFHHPHEHREAGRCFFVLGDWMEHFTYVVLQDGEFRLDRLGSA